MIETVTNHESHSFWEANLRKQTKEIQRKTGPPKTVGEYTNLMNMQPEKSHTRVGKRNDTKQIFSTDVVKVPQNVT